MLAVGLSLVVLNELLQLFHHGDQGLYGVPVIDLAMLSAMVEEAQAETPAGKRSCSTAQATLLNYRGSSLYTYISKVSLPSPFDYIDGADDTQYDEAKRQAEEFQTAHPGAEIMTGICKCLTDWFQPGTNTEHLTQKDGYQMCSKLFKVRANDILDLILHHGFTKEAVGQLRSLKTKDQGDVFMTKVKKRAREEPNDGLKHRLHFQAAHDGEQPANGTQVMLMDKFGELYDDQDTTYREANTITTKVLPGIRCFEIDNMDKGPWRQPRHHLWLEGPDRDPGEALVKRWIVAAAAASWQRHLRPAQQHWFKLQGVAVESKPPSKPSNHRICVSPYMFMS
ncbi:TPA: hypothetical protein ACH3X1_007691 [Trebouxia sp. C0004]